MQERHTNREQYFQEQGYTTVNYVMPFVGEAIPLTEKTSVLEIGCGEGGNLRPFLDMGCRVTGIDISESKIRKATDFLSQPEYQSQLLLVADDIYNLHDHSLKADLIMMRDVIEHIHDQERFMEFIKRFLNPGGVVFFAFPPWYNPFGGHQQICRSRFLSQLPYFHLCPSIIYTFLLKLFGESRGTIGTLMEIKQTGISIGRFQRILRKKNYHILRVRHYLINPNYQIKFKLTPRKQARFIASIPVVRDIFTTASYYLVSLSPIDYQKKPPVQ